MSSKHHNHVVFQFHCQNSFGSKIAEFWHDFPGSLHGYDFGTALYFEKFKEQIDPMQDHVSDCLMHSSRSCHACGRWPSTRVLVATKYYLRATQPLVKNFTTVICESQVCEENATEVMRNATRRLEKRLEFIERSLWQEVVYAQAETMRSPVLLLPRCPEDSVSLAASARSDSIPPFRTHRSPSPRKHTETESAQNSQLSVYRNVPNHEAIQKRILIDSPNVSSCNASPKTPIRPMRSTSLSRGGIKAHGHINEQSRVRPTLGPPATIVPISSHISEPIQNLLTSTLLARSVPRYRRDLLSQVQCQSAPRLSFPDLNTSAHHSRIVIYNTPTMKNQVSKVPLVLQSAIATSNADERTRTRNTNRDSVCSEIQSSSPRVMNHGLSGRTDVEKTRSMPRPFHTVNDLTGTGKSPIQALDVSPARAHRRGLHRPCETIDATRKRHDGPEKSFKLSRRMSDLFRRRSHGYDSA